MCILLYGCAVNINETKYKNILSEKVSDIPVWCKKEGPEQGIGDKHNYTIIIHCVYCFSNPLFPSFLHHHSLQILSGGARCKMLEGGGGGATISACAVTSALGPPSPY